MINFNSKIKFFQKKT